MKINYILSSDPVCKSGIRIRLEKNFLIVRDGNVHFYKAVLKFLMTKIKFS